MSTIWFNGKIVTSSSIDINWQHRGMRFGDGCFETIKVLDGKTPLLDYHLQRIMKACITLDLDFKVRPIALKSGIKKIASSADGIIRLYVWRKGEGAYQSTTNEVDCLMSFQPTEQVNYHIPDNGINIGVFLDVAKVYSVISEFKTTSALLYVLAANQVKQFGMDDLFIINEKQEVIETTNSNIFVIKEGHVYTPPITSGCVNGTARSFLWQHHPDLEERNMSIDFVKTADGIFTTNSIRFGWVKQFFVDGEQIQFEKPKLNLDFFK